MLSYSFLSVRVAQGAIDRQMQQLHLATNGGEAGTTGSEARKVFILPPRDERDDRKIARNAEDHAQEGGQGKKEWDLILPVLLFAYCDAVHESTGFSPFELTLPGTYVDRWMQSGSSGKVWRSSLWPWQTT